MYASLTESSNLVMTHKSFDLRLNIVSRKDSSRETFKSYFCFTLTILSSKMEIEDVLVCASNLERYNKELSCIFMVYYEFQTGNRTKARAHPLRFERTSSESGSIAPFHWHINMSVAIAIAHTAHTEKERQSVCTDIGIKWPEFINEWQPAGNIKPVQDFNIIVLSALICDAALSFLFMHKSA